MKNEALEMACECTHMALLFPPVVLFGTIDKKSYLVMDQTNHVNKSLAAIDSLCDSINWAS